VLMLILCVLLAATIEWSARRLERAHSATPATSAASPRPEPRSQAVRLLPKP
jgi:hypothetical protein